MRQPVVDYRQFRLYKIHHPHYSHLKLLFGWVVYFVFYRMTENCIPAENCTPVHCFLDDWIPFLEWFVIPYVLWYAMIGFSLSYFLLYNVESFRKLQIYFILLQLMATVIYILFPSRQDLRPQIFPRDNLPTAVVAFLYRVDTNTGVCPSMHVAFSFAMGSVWMKEKEIHVFWKGFVVFAVIMVCLSTMFIKQHSAVDFFAAIPLCLLCEIIVYGKYYRGY